MNQSKQKSFRLLYCQEILEDCRESAIGFCYSDNHQLKYSPINQHPALEPANILRVQTLDHVVYLNGLVDAELEREMAESVALEARGVAQVVNSIGLSNSR